MIARRYTRVQCAIIGFAVLTTGYIYFAPAIDLCVFMSIIDIEMCVSRDVQPIELCVFGALTMLKSAEVRNVISKNPAVY